MERIFTYLSSLCLNSGFTTLPLDKFTLDIYFIRISHNEGHLGIKWGVLSFNPLLFWLPEANGCRAILLHLRVCAHVGTLLETENMT